MKAGPYLAESDVSIRRRPEAGGRFWWSRRQSENGTRPLWWQGGSWEPGTRPLWRAVHQAPTGEAARSWAQETTGGGASGCNDHPTGADCRLTRITKRVQFQNQIFICHIYTKIRFFDSDML